MVENSIELRDIAGICWGKFFKFGTSVNLDWMMNLLNFGGQSQSHPHEFDWLEEAYNHEMVIQILGLVYSDRLMSTIK